ncbi:hypothetical protein QR680_004005 [Steinernema hermaphroditum]|uniref:CUB-like domain-containing protein n=1 Tax=Steinernema hermaphroditum TaxID=289476 RepID=A0AA39HPL0_9BILA|nr:hypothetical protein QR680_004005 [Steinernema hermaphroditum]
MSCLTMGCGDTDDLVYLHRAFQKTPEIKMLPSQFLLIFLTTVPCLISGDIQFTECPKNSGKSVNLTIPPNGVTGIRSHDWPNSMTGFYGKLLFGTCGFDIKGTSNQTVAAFFTNAHFYYSTPSLDGSVDTNDRNFVHTMNGGEISFEARGAFVDSTMCYWWGFEAIVGAYDNENMCPFESDAVVEVDDSAPRVIASQWYFDDDSATLPQRKCQWTFAPKAGYKLKIAFSVFIINATDESVRLYEDAHPVFNLGSSEELPSRVFYTEKNFPFHSFPGCRQRFSTRCQTRPQCAADVLPFYNKNLSINFESSDKFVTNQYENGNVDIKASYVDLVSLRSKNTVRFINDSADSVLFSSASLKYRFSSVTFTLSKELSSKKLQLYVISTEDSIDIDTVLIMDGDLSHAVSAISNYDLLNNATVTGPITSTTGNITVLLAYASPVRYSAAMFLKVYDDSRDCSDADSVFSAPPHGDTLQTTYTVESQNSKLLVCPITILSLPGSFGDAMNFGINDIQGTDKSVKVLPGTDHNANPFYEVSKSTLNLWGPTSLYGEIFTILLPVETILNFSISKTQIPRDAISIDYYVHKMGIFMTPNYPNGGCSKEGLTSRSLKVIDYGSADNTFKAKFEVFGNLSPSSSLHVLANKKVVLNATSETKLQSSYDTGYASVVSFEYSGPESEKGFFIRYELIPSPKSSHLSISAVLELNMTVSNLIV